MKTVEFVQRALQISDQFADRYFEDMRDIATVQPTSRGGNHALWIAGHFASTEAEVRKMITGETSPLEHWGKHFGPGTQPTGEESDYPSYDEVLAAYREQRQRTRRVVAELDDADLDRKLENVPEEVESLFRTVADPLWLLIAHQWFHQGQLADARRVAGRSPLTV